MMFEIYKKLIGISLGTCPIFNFYSIPYIIAHKKLKIQPKRFKQSLLSQLPMGLRPIGLSSDAQRKS